MPSTTGRNDLATEKMIVDRVHDCQYGTDGVFGDTIYILALPYGVLGSGTGSDGAGGFTCGAHFTTSSGVPFVEQQYFSGVDACFVYLGPAETAVSSVTSTAFHEIAEAIVIRLSTTNTPTRITAGVGCRILGGRRSATNPARIERSSFVPR